MNSKERFITSLHLGSRAFFITIIIVLILTIVTENVNVGNVFAFQEITNNQTIALTDDKSKDIESLTKEIKSLESQKKDLEYEIENYKQEIENLNSNIKDTCELYSKYSYAVDYKNINPNADFGMAELIFLNDTCNEYGVPIEIMLAIFEKESGFCSTAKNPSSTATGYGQLINYTAKSMYERFCQFGTYDLSNHKNICSDKELNITLSCRLMKYNLENYGSKWEAVERYFNHPSAILRYEYAKDISNRMANYNSSLL